MISKNQGLSKFKIEKYKGANRIAYDDQIAVESILQIKLSHGKGKQRSVDDFAIVLRTPGEDKNLILGLLYSEGIISSTNDVISLREEHNPSDEGKAKILHVELNPNLIITPQLFNRNTLSNSSCGLCGKQTLEMMNTCIYPILSPDNLMISFKDVIDTKDFLTDHQTLFSTTGGSHATTIVDKAGNILALCEDVGRHNAMDKAIGQLLTANLLQGNKDYFIGLVSGRVSYELVHKALLARITILIALGAPSSLAIEMAEENGLTLVGFLKTNSFNIYTHGQRIA